jgi:hypothetical protein
LIARQPDLLVNASTPPPRCPPEEPTVRRSFQSATGFLGVDLVAHPRASALGSSVRTTILTDVATGPTACRLSSSSRELCDRSLVAVVTLFIAPRVEQARRIVMESSISL